MMRFAPLFLLCIVLGACGGGSGGGGGGSTLSSPAPTNLTYPNNNSESFVSGTSVNISPASISGTTPITYSISPALPTGLTINSSTGVISGTPTVVQVATNYTITATNAAGSFNVTISIAVTSSGTPPSNLTYPNNNSESFVSGTSVNISPASISGTTPISYSISPALPTGLTINSSSGVISGTPTVVQPATNYTTTATNAAGSFNVTISISVTSSGTPPSNLTYQNNNSESFVSGTSVNISPASISGTTPITYSISPALPTGLTINSSTGVISGTPTVAQLASNYTITASNSAGSVSTSITIQVNAVLSWTIIDNYGPGDNIYVNFWDETIGNYAWPGSNLIFTATPGSNTYDLNCILGDLICYGADANTTELGFYWGVDILNNEPYQSCENDSALPCCHICANASYSITLDK